MNRLDLSRLRSAVHSEAIRPVSIFRGCLTVSIFEQRVQMHRAPRGATISAAAAEICFCGDRRQVREADQKQQMNRAQPHTITFAREFSQMREASASKSLRLRPAIAPASA